MVASGRASAVAQLTLAFVDSIGQRKDLDKLGEVVEGLARPLTSPTPIKNALSGTWAGHRLHPALTDLAIGAFLGASVVDLTAPGSTTAARRLVATGLLASLPTVASGLSDWVDVYDEGRRIGLVHGAANLAALALLSGSYVRRRGRSADNRGTIIGAAGLAVLSVGAYLGGHLTQVLGVGVDHTAFEPSIEGWTDVHAADNLVEGKPAVVRAGEIEVLLVRLGDDVLAMANRCSHAGWPLADGEIHDGCITCPYHGSVFSLRDGRVRGGPAASPQRTFAVRERDGRLEVRSAPAGTT